MQIIIDAAAQLNPERVKELGMDLVDYPILIKGELFESTWDMPDWEERKAELTRLIQNKETMAGTQGLPEKDLLETFRKYEGQEILMIPQSLNNTKATGETLRKIVSEHPEINLKIFDSQRLTGAYTAQVVAAAIYAKKTNCSRAELMEYLEKNRPNAHHAAILYDLFYLHRSGRIGLAKAVLGTAMKVIPILAETPESGIIKSIGKVKNYTQANQRFLQILTKQMEEVDSKALTVTMSYNSDHLAECRQFEEMLKKQAAEKGWKAHIEINITGFACIPHMGPDYFEIGYVVHT